MSNDEVLQKLSQMLPADLDKMRDETQLELKGILRKYYVARDEELTKRHEKRKELLKENSLSKTEQLLRADEELYLLKKKILASSTKKKETELKISILSSYYWKNKGG